ncbi:replication initiation protein [Ideonella paludis]|nr:replication initiation protein [Ideonella paludis]
MSSLFHMKYSCPMASNEKPSAANVGSPEASGYALGAATFKKPVNTLAIVPKSARITTLGRKAYNVLLHNAQIAGLEQDVFKIPLEQVVKGVDFGSNDHALIKKYLRAMVSTTVEWQSPTSGEGNSWNVSGLLAHARLYKERNQVWLEYSYAVNLKQELLDPTVFARLKLEVVSQLRTHAGIALYEICTRYKNIPVRDGQLPKTARQDWRWWRPVLSGQPETEKTAKLEYRIFKRDTLKPAVAEINAITDLEIELVEHREGRFVRDIQFSIRQKPQVPLPLRQAPQPVDLTLSQKGADLGIDDEKVEELVSKFGQDAVRAGLVQLEERAKSAFPAPLRDPYRYLLSLMPAVSERAAVAAVQEAERRDPTSRESRAAQERQQTAWRDEWLRRRRRQIADEIRALSEEEQLELTDQLDQALAQRNAHPSIRKRLGTSGWQHPLVEPEMIMFYAEQAHGGIGSPTPEDLLQIAAETATGLT